jgi:hypothetical protein
MDKMEKEKTPGSPRGKEASRISFLMGSEDRRRMSTIRYMMTDSLGDVKAKNLAKRLVTQSMPKPAFNLKLDPITGSAADTPRTQKTLKAQIFKSNFTQEASQSEDQQDIMSYILKVPEMKLPVIPPIQKGGSIHDLEANHYQDLESHAIDPKSPFSFIKSIKDRDTNEFVYLRPVPIELKFGQPTFNPYNLEIVDYADLDIKSPEGYYTLSKAVSLDHPFILLSILES